MNTLSDLNSYGQTSLEYTDNRSAQVVFDRPVADNQNYDAAVNEVHQVPLGIEILEIIKPEVVNVFYEIDVTGITGATVTWPTIPSGCTVTNPSAGIYRLNFINNKETWDIVKRPNISVPGRTVDFTYTPKVKYEPSQTKSWSVFIRVTVKIAMSSQFTMPLARLRGDQLFRAAFTALSSLQGLIGKRLLYSAAMSSTASVTMRARFRFVGRAALTSAATITPRVNYRMVSRSTINLTATIIPNARKIAILQSAISSAFTEYLFTQPSYTVAEINPGGLNSNDNFGARIESLGDDELTVSTTTGKVFAFQYDGSSWATSFNATVSNPTNLTVAFGTGGATPSGRTAGSRWLLVQNGSSNLLYNKNTSNAWVLWDGNFSSSYATNTTSQNRNFIRRSGNSFIVNYWANPLGGSNWDWQTVTYANAIDSGRTFYFDSANPQHMASALFNGVGPIVWRENTTVNGFPTTYLRMIRNNINNGSYQLSTSLFRTTSTDIGKTSYAVTARSDYPLIAEGYFDDGANGAGFVKMHSYSDSNFNQLAERQTIVSPNNAAGNKFGQSIALRNVYDGFNYITYMAVSAPGEAGGAVYIYRASTPASTQRYDSFSLYAILRLDNSETGMNFGSSVRWLSDNMLAVGASGLVSSQGRVYVYTFKPSDFSI